MGFAPTQGLPHAMIAWVQPCCRSSLPGRNRCVGSAFGSQPRDRPLPLVVRRLARFVLIAQPLAQRPSQRLRCRFAALLCSCGSLVLDRLLCLAQRREEATPQHRLAVHAFRHRPQQAVVAASPLVRSRLSVHRSLLSFGSSAGSVPRLRRPKEANDVPVALVHDCCCAIVVRRKHASRCSSLRSLLGAIVAGVHAKERASLTVRRFSP